MTVLADSSTSTPEQHDRRVYAPHEATIEASLRLIDELEREIGECERELRRLGADHRYFPLLCTVPGISWVLAYTIVAEIGDIDSGPLTIEPSEGSKRLTELH